MQMNPAYKIWKNKQQGGGAAATNVVPVNANALPVVSNMEDHMKMNEDLGEIIPLAQSTDGKQKLLPLNKK